MMQKDYKFSVLGLLSFPFAMVADNVRKFFLSAVYAAALMTAVSVLLGSSYLCTYPQLRVLPEMFCTDSSALLLANFLLRLFVLAIFFNRYALTVFLQQKISWAEFLRPSLADLKSFAVLLAFLLLNSVALLSLYLLFIRVPNPDWHIEIVYFAVVSIGFVIPFLLIRFYPLMVLLFCQRRIVPLIKDCWHKTSVSYLKLFAPFLLILPFSLILMLGFFNNFKNFTAASGFQIVVVEFLYNLALLLIFAIIANYGWVVKQMLHIGENND